MNAGNRHRGAKGAEDEGDEADAAGADAGIVGCATVSAGRVDLLAVGHVGQHHPGEDRDKRHPQRLHADDVCERVRERAEGGHVEVSEDIADLAAD